MRKKGEAIEASSNRVARISACLIAVTISFFFLSFPFHALNGLLIDSYFRLGGAAAPHPGLTLIAFDPGSLSTLASLIRRISSERPKAIGILADIDTQSFSEAELKGLVEAIDGSIPVFVGFTNDSSLGRPVPEIFGDRLVYSPGLVSRDSYNYGADSVSRRVMMEIDRVPTFFSRLAIYLRGRTPDRIEALGSSRHAYIRWQGPAGTYPIHSAWEVLRTQPSRLALQDQIVLLGTVRKSRPTQDFVLTPFSRTLGETTLLEGAAQGLVTLIRDDGLRKLPFWAVATMTVGVGLLTVMLVASLSPIRGILFMLGLLTTLWSAGWLALFWGGWWLDLAHPALMAVASYYLVVPFRLGLEYRKRWHYQQKTEMMAQLEALKSNFLSLVSHDLKTPIARIQGNAELLLREPQGLVDRQRKGLATIVATTEQMSDYVETVLDLTRIESAKTPLKKDTRDINATILEVIEEKRFLAQEKKISIETDLEPLFSIRYDVKLMRRVFANLLENAVKYSPEKSTILISSREEKGAVRLSFRDQGSGIAKPEQEKVFTKFYRGEGTVGSGIKGTGLGLYLVKYFVELHKGTVCLESELGKGSTFSVSLPV